MVVLKIGGSLYASPCLREWLSIFPHNSQTSVMMVPGGGPFADQVRAATGKWDLPADCAHNMAVLGMQQFAHLLVGLNRQLVLKGRDKFMDAEQEIPNAMVWAPYDDVLNADDLEKDWQTTSDSLALWLATKLSASHLCIVKSAAIDGKSLNTLIKEEIVDNNFAKLLPDYSGRIHFYHAADAQQFQDDLNSDIFS